MSHPISDSDAEREQWRYFHENVPYGAGHSDGVNGNKPKCEHYGDHELTFYKKGFEAGRKQLRNNYQRSLMNDYGAVLETA